ncbi:MAG: hypothetical protein J6S21_00795, partial [Victivallales bacterium]|nr:hypothetical protein [Victivallales bacterium]
LAMEQLLHSPDCQKFIADYQDTSEPLLRQRIHQLSIIAENRQIMDTLIRRFERNSLDIWQCALMLDKTYDPRTTRRYLNNVIREFQREMPASGGELTLAQVGEFMKYRNFHVPQLPWFSIDFFLISSVILNGAGIPLLLCVLAARLARTRNLVCSICLKDGKVCLADNHGNLLDPLMNWELTQVPQEQQLFYCSNQNLVRILLAQLQSSSIIAWEYFDAHAFSRLMQRLDNVKGSSLPYPLGDLGKPESRR